MQDRLFVQLGFDLEKARASIAHYRIENPSNVDTESALKELVDQANLAEDALAEIERLQASLIDLHAEYINTLEKNPGCSAWDLDEQSDADQRRLRKNAAHAISIVEPPIYLQADQQVAKIKELKADLEQSERVIDQQAARIKSLKKEIRRLKHESKVEQEFTNSYIKRLHDAEARIKELGSSLDEAEALTKKNAELMNGYLRRIAELEDALVEERAGAIRCESYDHCEGMYRIDLPDAMIRAQQELQAEGKIGLDAAKPRSWQITEERVGLLEYCLETLLDAPDIEEIPGPGHSIEVLRAMLTEAGQ